MEFGFDSDGLSNVIFQDVRPNYLKRRTVNHKVTFNSCSGCYSICQWFSIAQQWKFSQFPTPVRWNCSSSLIKNLLRISGFPSNKFNKTSQNCKRCYWWLLVNIGRLQFCSDGSEKIRRTFGWDMGSSEAHFWWNVLRCAQQMPTEGNVLWCAKKIMPTWLGGSCLIQSLLHACLEKTEEYYCERWCLPIKLGRNSRCISITELILTKYSLIGTRSRIVKLAMSN